MAMSGRPTVDELLAELQENFQPYEKLPKYWLGTIEAKAIHALLDPDLAKKWPNKEILKNQLICCLNGLAESMKPGDAVPGSDISTKVSKAIVSDLRNEIKRIKLYHIKISANILTCEDKNISEMQQRAAISHIMNLTNCAVN